MIICHCGVNSLLLPVNFVDFCLFKNMGGGQINGILSS